MVKIHNLKLDLMFADDIYYNRKTFEVRYNDRIFKKNDFIKFRVVNEGIIIDHPLNEQMYVISYILHDWGLKEGYVCMSIRPVTSIYYDLRNGFSVVNI